jgi:hypothetical protein
MKRACALARKRSAALLSSSSPLRSSFANTLVNEACSAVSLSCLGTLYMIKQGLVWEVHGSIAGG